jgi:hypothetical protein
VQHLAGRGFDQQLGFGPGIVGRRHNQQGRCGEAEEEGAVAGTKGQITGSGQVVRAKEQIG